MNNSALNASCLLREDGSFGPVADASCRAFDFTIVFEQSFFSIAPAAILIVTAPLRLRRLSKDPAIVAGSDPSRRAKLAAIAAFAALQLSLVAAWAAQPAELGRLRTVSLAAACVSLVGSLAMGGVSYSEHARSPRPSGLLNAYLLVSLALDGAMVRSFWLSGLGTAVCGLVTASFAIKAGIMVLEAVEKRRLLGARRSPEVTSGLYGTGPAVVDDSAAEGGI